MLPVHERPGHIAAVGQSPPTISQIWSMSGKMLCSWVKITVMPPDRSLIFLHTHSFPGQSSDENGSSSSRRS